uniref:UBC core domain-containing protein n=1 Tax=Alexandrium catenella TaxID=2925 RepID=A0A7S1KYS8_ALECA
MAMLARVQQDLAELASDAHVDASAEVVKPIMGGDVVWHCALSGPSMTPYEGGVFKLCVRFPEAYPMQPPLLRFATKIFHCNVSPDGWLALESLGGGWSPSTTLSQVLSAVVGLLVQPDPMAASVPEIAALLHFDRRQHDSMARRCTRRFAMA